MKTAQLRLGHSDPRLTLALYAQAVEGADRRAAESLGEQFFGTSKPIAAIDARWAVRGSGGKQTRRRLDQEWR